MRPNFYQMGQLEVLEKLGMARNTPGLLGGPPRVSAGSINEEYKNLLLQHGGSPMVRHHLREAALPVPQVALDTAGILAAMRARLQGPQNPQVAAAQTAEAQARSGVLQAKPVVKVSADMIQPDPLASFRRSGNISQAFDTNAGMGNNSLGNPGMANPPTTLSMGNLSNAMRWQSDQTGGSAVGIPA
jgi:hypothetical protein